MDFHLNFYKNRFRNPNEPPEPEHGGRQERNRFKNIEWTPYESVHKKYLNLGESFGLGGFLVVSMPTINL